MAELLLAEGYEVHGLVRRVAIEDSSHRNSRISKLTGQIQLHAASLESYPSIFKAMQRLQPDECYHLAAQSFVSHSFEDEFSTLNTNISGTHYMLSALKDACPACRFYFAASSEMFGKVRQSPQNESTPFHPRSAYGISKVAGYHLTRNYREAYGLHATSGILYNHESPRRGFEFVTRKITSHVARIKYGLATELRLGNLDAIRDWGHAADYVRGMWMMLQQEKADDFVIATGVTRTVKDFCELAFSVAGLHYEDYVKTDPRFVRPTEVDILQGDASKARKIMGWEPTRSFEQLVTEMVEHDLTLCAEEARRATVVVPAAAAGAAAPTPLEVKVAAAALSAGKAAQSAVASASAGPAK